MAKQVVRWVVKRGEKYQKYEGATSDINKAFLYQTQKDAKDNSWDEQGEKTVKVFITVKEAKL